MTSAARDLVAALNLETEEAFGEIRIRTTPERILEVLEESVKRGYTLFCDLSAVDYLEREPRFDLVYLLRRPEDADLIEIKVGVREEETVPSSVSLLKGANWAEREIFDLFGIPFDGHPDLTRILLPDDWEGHPLRRDYPLVGTEPSPPLATE